MPWYQFHWDEDTVSHIALHAITQDEFEEVVCNPDSVGESNSTGRPIAFGYSSTGRYLACIYEFIDPVTIQPVTAFEVED